ncbi:Calmodulin and related proteins (EF-Hand superfamily) [Handroanthus impetiginosus]|uniref:Calmodulin and related proteins (EF-Hand superfamily) n=1 Tax=Handroanthus impetiginosus TaxID=429701 RepID=A0A2G9HPI5_9LAMI|nr:Calmodulin and related proteins (EF-Hand superfamily) [Handroanthus impetiginosus]
MSRFSFLSFNRSSSKKPSTPKPPAINHTRSKELQKPPSIQSKNLQPKIEELKTIFNKFDTNGDGKISLEEYKQALKIIGGATTKNEAAQAFRAADADGDGFIEFEEFSKVFSTDGGVKSSEIEESFKAFDADGDGKISAEELMGVLRRMGEKCSLEGCKKMIRGVDRDGDGYIDMDEFITMMTQNMKIV